MRKSVTKLLPVTLLVGGLAAQSADRPQNVYFGDLHLHTRYSNDASIYGTTRTPDDATDSRRAKRFRISGASRFSSTLRSIFLP